MKKFIKEYLEDNGYNCNSYESSAAAEEIAHAMQSAFDDVVGRLHCNTEISHYIQVLGIDDENSDNYASSMEIRKAMKAMYKKIETVLEDNI